MKILKNGIISVALLMSLAACGDHDTVVYQQPVQPVATQPVYVNNPDPMAGVLAGIAIGSMISDGHGGHVRYDGHNGYYDRRYRGPSRTVVRNTTIVNKTVVNNVDNRANNPNNIVPKTVLPVASPVSNNVAKIKNPGDELAAKEKALMQAEQAQKAKQAQLKADLQAKQAARASGDSVRSNGFNQMSKKSSTTSYTSKSFTSGISSTKSGRR